MVIGVLKENLQYENRVAVTANIVKSLTSSGHKVTIEKGSGENSFVSDDELITWEEDNITLGMSNKQSSRGIGIIKYLNLLINIVLLIAVFGG